MLEITEQILHSDEILLLMASTVNITTQVAGDMRRETDLLYLYLDLPFPAHVSFILNLSLFLSLISVFPDSVCSFVCLSVCLSATYRPN